MAGLSLLSDRKQTHFPRGMLAVYMIVAFGFVSSWNVEGKKRSGNGTS
uniref:Uncharacterized protein n=1 Tax=Parascaris equorum TaxID=6256 RepID=A0A914S1P1_PAREQ